VTGWILAMIFVPVVVAEITELSPWLARRCARFAARRLPTVRARERFAEEWCADLARVPGKFTKLCYAISLLLVAVPRLRALDRRAEREVPGMLAARDRAIAVFDAIDDIDAFAELVASSFASTFGYGGVVVNLEVGGDFQSVAICGSSAMRTALLGRISPRSAVEKLVSSSEPRGTLRYLGRDNMAENLGVQTYIPPTRGTIGLGPDEWTPEDGLLAPLFADDGRLLGLLSIDEPLTGRFPGPAQLAMIEAYSAYVAHKFDILYRTSARSA